MNLMVQCKLDKRNPDRIERWFAEIWNSTEKYPISLNSLGPHGGSVWEWLGWSRKIHAVSSYLGSGRNAMSKGSIPEGEYLLATENGKVFHSLPQLRQASPGLAFDVLLTANGLDHALLGAPGEHGQRFRHLFIDIKNHVWAAKQEKMRGGARFMKAEAQKVSSDVAIACGRNPIGESVQGSRFLWGEEPTEMRILAEIATGYSVKCHSDALDVQSLGLEFQRLGRQISYGESAQVAAQEIVVDAKGKGWITENRFHKTKGYQYQALEPRFDQGRLMSSSKARLVNGLSVIDLAVGKLPPDVEQKSLF
jgi:hypothetical protein